MSNVLAIFLIIVGSAGAVGIVLGGLLLMVGWTDAIVDYEIERQNAKSFIEFYKLREKLTRSEKL